ncbi:MAG TPA: capsule assembly Wzi family protein [Gemmatimonadaceae bacterium]|nr:capsule assembly Wzi family protein [Gemmatimonadaceae bacterium]
MNNWRRSAALFLFFGLGWSSAAAAQTPAAVNPVAAVDTVAASLAARNTTVEVTVDDAAVSRLRLLQLGGEPTSGFLLRSTSSMLDRASAAGARGWQRLPFSTRMVMNTAMPTAANDGALWAGKGISSITTFGARFAGGPLRIVVAPQAVALRNADWKVRDTMVFWSPNPAPGRIGRAYAFSWYQGQFSIDLPQRFGDESRAFIDPGQSSIYMKIGGVDAGAGTENHWWGPGIRNALVLSNAAPGFFHLFLRSARPLETRVGIIEWRWIVGGLKESDYFDATPENDLRSLSAFGVAVQPWFASDLTLGAARSVMGTATGWGKIPVRWFEAFHATGRTTEQLAWDAAGPAGGREQILSLFARYVMPDAGAELYGEWGRTELPTSLRDLFIAPNHTQGYTVGFQWARPVSQGRSRFRAQGEITTLEQSATFRDRPLGTWYSGRRIVQGYTHRGEMLGAVIGPGSSAQWFALDFIAPRSAIGAYLTRTRWNEDIHSIFDWPDYLQYCNHDVSVEAGVRGERWTRFGRLGGDVGLGHRRNVFFERAGCAGPTYRDIHNVGIRFSFAPGR